MAFKLFVTVLAIIIVAATSGARAYEQYVYEMTTTFNSSDCTGGAVYVQAFLSNSYSCQTSACIPAQPTVALYEDGNMGSVQTISTSVRVDCSSNFVGSTYSLGVGSIDQSTDFKLYLADVHGCSFSSPGLPSSVTVLPFIETYIGGSVSSYGNLSAINECLVNTNDGFAPYQRFNCTNDVFTVFYYNDHSCTNFTNIAVACHSNHVYFCATGAASLLQMLGFAALAMMALLSFTVSSRLSA